jgi:hypothetical protein
MCRLESTPLGGSAATNRSQKQIASKPRSSFAANGRSVGRRYPVYRLRLPREKSIRAYCTVKVTSSRKNELGLRLSSTTFKNI